MQHAVRGTYIIYYCIRKEACVVAISYIIYNTPTQRKQVIVCKIYDTRIYLGEYLCHNSISLLSIGCHFHPVTASNIIANIQWLVHYSISYSCSNYRLFFSCESQYVNNLYIDKPVLQTYVVRNFTGRTKSVLNFLVVPSGHRILTQFFQFHLRMTA